MNPQSPYIASLDMYITKATNDGRVMRWQAVNSDTDKDSYAERMSYELYQNMLENIRNEIPVPEIFRNEVCSNYWCGGMPYVSISHYSDINGDAVPGEPLELYIDGDERKARLKAKGILFDNPLGHSVYRALKEDKVKNPEEKIRISIGFLDLAHKHGEDGVLFIRDSLASRCQECADGVGEKIYVKGYLVHLALTRVPVNKRTEMVLEEKSMTAKKAKTRKEDAASIIGSDLAEEIDAKNKVIRSDLLVEMSDTEDKSDDVEDKPEETETPAAPVVEVPVLTQESEAPVEPEVEKGGYTLPYGGAVSMVEARKTQEAAKEMYHVMDTFSMFQQVAWNIFDRDDVTDKKALFTKAVDEFKSMLATKALVEFSQASADVEVEDAHELQPAIDALLETIDNSTQLKSDVNEKLQAINPALQELGTAITDFVSKSVNVDSDEPAPALNDNVAEILKNLIQPIANGVNELSQRLGVLESKSTAQNVPAQQRIPSPRSMVIAPNLTQKSESSKTKPGSLRDIMNKSVGLIE